MKRKSRERLDVLMVERGLAESRAKAKGLIMAGAVLVEGQVKDKPGSLVSREAEISLKHDPCPYVSRGGLKLAGALRDFKIKVEGRKALDVGASTGGFTDCLLREGAVKVYALDVGKGQLDWKLRNDERVKVIEETNIRHFDQEIIKDRVDLVTIDVSFISLEKVLPKVAEILKGRGEILALVKPQFELGPKHVGKGGVVRSPEKRKEAVEKVISFSETLGLECRGEAHADIKGPKGNQEYFIYLVFST